MDAQKIGQFIAQQRNELHLTQAELAARLHVTDKAISRWERGIGLPDINLLEPLAQALDVNLIELVQAQKTTKQSISIEDAQSIVSDTIQLSGKGEGHKAIGIGILGLMGIMILFLFRLLITDGSIVAYSVGSLVTGLLAWAIPIWKITLSKTAKTAMAGLLSLGTALTSLAIQFFQLAHEVKTGDFAAIEDTAHALCIVVVLFCAVTLFLNFLMLSKHRR